jgi:CBS domain containing-hemolysin-like protein
MIVLAIGILLIGLLLSAMFSGTEIGFYRVPKIRLQIDAIGGDRTAKRLFWLTNRPSLFVATTLVGNNLANYLCSFGAVLLIEMLLRESGGFGEMVATLMLTPLLFVYGELMPKYLFMNAPNQFLRRVIPFFLIFVPIFYPISFFLEQLNRLLARSMGQSQQPLLSRLARKELQRALDEGQAVGLLLPVQRRLARDLFAARDLPVHRFAEPVSALPCARLDMNREQVLRLARRYHLAEILMAESSRERLSGYLRVIDLELAQTVPPEVVVENDLQHSAQKETASPAEAVDDQALFHALMRPLVSIRSDASPLDAMVQLQEARQSLGRLVDHHGETIGILSSDKLLKAFFSGGLDLL